MDLNLGVVTRSFPHLTNEETAELLASEGFRCTELCFSQTDSKYWVYNGRSDLSDMTPARSRKIVQTYRDRGIEVTTLGVFTSLIEPDDDERQANLDYFVRMMEIAADTGVPSVTTECGFIPGSRGINADEYEERYQRVFDSFRWLLDKAEDFNLDIALEPCILDVVPSAKRTADFISQLGSSHM
ncbi:MAG: sugar phosphate isomerase/epimerase, partial [Lentisphaeria bacterium]|nr:sugar phosphate isomerase/epimerase [Lentisphaeria bacterium]